MTATTNSRPRAPWRERLRKIIFEAETPSGKAFDVALLIIISLSVLVVMLESVSEYREKYGPLLIAAEWCFTVLFTIEYVLRLITIERPLRYARSFYGMVDLFAFLPTYLQLLLPGETHYLLVIRILRLLRLFRIFKMVRYIGGGNIILTALRASRPRIIVFLFGVVSLAIVIGTILYIIEGGTNPGFTSIPKATYWAIVTITTVGYGDISPVHPLGQFVASIAMLTGYAIIAVPTGIVGAEMHRQLRLQHEDATKACPACGVEGHAVDALYCRRCGGKL